MPSAQELRKLELELLQLTKRRIDQQRRIANSERVHRSCAARAAPELASAQHAAAEVAPAFIHRTLSDEIDEAALYALFLKHGTSLAQDKFAFGAAERYATEEERSAEAAQQQLRGGLRGRKVDGGLDKWELEALMTELGAAAPLPGPEREAAAKRWLRQLDADGNGTVEWNELRAWWAKGGGSYRVKAPSLAELAVQRLAAPSQRLGRMSAARRRRWEAARADAAARQQSSARAPPPLPVLDGAYSDYGRFGMRAQTPPPQPTVARAPRHKGVTFQLAGAPAGKTTPPRVDGTQRGHAQPPASALTPRPPAWRHEPAVVHAVGRPPRPASARPAPQRTVTVLSVA